MVLKIIAPPTPTEKRGAESFYDSCNGDTLVSATYYLNEWLNKNPKKEIKRMFVSSNLEGNTNIIIYWELNTQI